jgi:hypothetical protein
MKFKLFVIKILRLFQRIICRIKYQIIVSKRKNISVYDTKKLSQDIPLSIIFNLKYEKNNSNLFYNNASNLKKYGGLSSKYKIPYAIEHGIYLDNRAWLIDIESDTTGIITFSDYRKQVLSRITNKPVVPIGPYIHYVDSYLSPQEIEEERKKLGHTLLVFLSHSTNYIDVTLNYEKERQHFLEIGKDFDTIMICLYWKDALVGVAQQFSQTKFRCVTAGHIFDPLFLSRLKSIIQLSDQTMSTSLGTHLGYCIYLGKPHYTYFTQKIIESIGPVKRHWENIGKEEQDNTKDLIMDNFSRFQNYIDPDQKKVVEYIWGTNHIKTKKEMYDILYGNGLN